MLTDDNAVYSHVGIVYKTDDTLLIVHSVPAEEPGGIDRVKAEPLELFLLYERAAMIAVLRLKSDVSPAIGNNAADNAFSFAEKKVLFDGDFDLLDPERLYCTELVWRSFYDAGLDIIDGNFDELSLPLGDGPYLLPSTVLESNYFEPILYSTTN
jgi:hypothetical protein